MTIGSCELIAAQSKDPRRLRTGGPLTASLYAARIQAHESISSVVQPMLLDRASWSSPDDIAPMELLTVPSRAFSIQQTRGRRGGRV